MYAAPAGTTAIPNTTIESAKYNAYVADITADLNLVRPILAGGTGASTAAAARTALGAVAAASPAFTGTASLTHTAAGSLLTLESTDAGAGNGPGLTLYRNSASPAASDVIGALFWQGRDSAANVQSYGTHYGFIVDHTSGSEDFSFNWETNIAGANSLRMSLGAGLYMAGAADPGTGKIAVVAGDAAAPSLTLADADSGLFGAGPATGISVNGVETARFAATLMHIGKTTADSGVTAGIELYKGGFTALTRSADTILQINRLTDDGTLVSLMGQGVAEGGITVSTTTIAYTTFCGCHESQLSTDEQRSQLLPGTVMEAVDELCDWYGRVEHLAKCKISDTAESPAVYGVFFDFYDSDPEEDTVNVASLGAFRIRVNAGEKVTAGDLLVSAGNGCAKVQDDDIMRSKTIAKVTSSKKIEKYPDGSYLVPCTLHCG